MADLTQWHGYKESVRWRLTDRGVEIEGSGLERTPGEPVTVTRIWERHSADINRASQEFGVPAVIILATTATEANGNPRALRKEPGYTSDNATPHRISAGMMQTLISTARSALGDESITREWLYVPLNSLRAGTAYIAQQKPKTDWDPPKVAAAYNAGGVYHQTGRANRWKMRQYPIGTGEHCDRFVRWFNDAVAVLTSHSIRPAVGYEVLLGDVTPPKPKEPERRISATVTVKPGVRIESDEAKAMHQTILDAAKVGAIPNCRITSGYRPKAGGFHGRKGTNGWGTALDLGGPVPGRDTEEMGAIFHAIASLKRDDGSFVANELIYAGPQTDYNVDQHKRRSKYAEASHHDHVHWGVEKGVFPRWTGAGFQDFDEEEEMGKLVADPGRKMIYLVQGTRVVPMNRPGELPDKAQLAVDEGFAPAGPDGKGHVHIISEERWPVYQALIDAS